MKRPVAWLIAAVVAVGAHGAAPAIEVREADRVIDGRRVFVLTGAFQVNDDARFDAALKNVTKAIIDMNSPGGNLFAGIAIGERIAQRRYHTIVADRNQCASACALAWLAGTRRYVVASGLVGFHAAYVSRPDGDWETGMGNAVIGEYLSRRIRLERAAVMCITAAPPHKLNWLTPDMSRDCKIPYQHVAHAADIESSVSRGPDRVCSFQNWISVRCTVRELWCSWFPGWGCVR